MPARGWHGEAYRGHVFWDELFIFPFFNLQQPRWPPHCSTTGSPACRRPGGGARGRPPGGDVPLAERLQRARGDPAAALNPKSGRWLPDHSHLQRHVNIAIAYNVWQHYLVTAGNGFLRFVGAELLVEIARFWSSITTWNADEGR